MRKLALFALFLLLLTTSWACRRRNTDFVTIGLPEKFTAFDTLTSVSNDAAAERIKTLMFNSLVRKDANFDYVGELAKEIDTSEDGLTLTFVLHDGVKFHNGKELTSADVKYTYEQMIASGGFKSKAFFDTVPADGSAKPAVPPAKPADNTNTGAKPKEAPTKSVPQITSMETPDAKTFVVKISRPAVKNLLLSNMVAIPIIPEGSISQQKDSPLGSGPFKFVSFDASQNIVEMAANTEYWEGAPKIAKLRVKTVPDANSLQAELQTGGVDIAPNPSNLPPDIIRSIGNSGDLKMDQFDGSNIQYLLFNTQSPPLDNVKVRQAIAYAIDRQKIVNDLLFGQAKVADAVLPPQSWAYTPGTQYNYDPEKAKKLLQEAGYKDQPVKFKYGAGNAATNQYAQVIHSSLHDVGINVDIETLEVNVIRQQMAQGQFQMYTGVWVGGNQDPIFMRDLFSSTKIPSESVSCCNRGRYSNPDVDKMLAEAVETTDRARAKELYTRSWERISADMPFLPLWYPANIVIYNKRLGNIKISPSGDWSFVKDVTVSQ